MDPEVVFSGIAVLDFSAAVAWYERVFGRAADIVVNDDEVMWRMTDSAWIYVVRDATRVGRALVALSVPSLDGAVHELSRRGVDAGPMEVVGEAGRKVAITDSEGNTVSTICVTAARPR